jgi:hypothetical protein
VPGLEVATSHIQIKQIPYSLNKICKTKMAKFEMVTVIIFLIVKFKISAL